MNFYFKFTALNIKQFSTHFTVATLILFLQFQHYAPGRIKNKPYPKDDEYSRQTK
jgi:hypothetical protein